MQVINLIVSFKKTNISTNINSWMSCTEKEDIGKKLVMEKPLIC